MTLSTGLSRSSFPTPPPEPEFTNKNIYGRFYFRSNFINVVKRLSEILNKRF
jgi:hypothetical protein